MKLIPGDSFGFGFKPYYNWNTFNTKKKNIEGGTDMRVVLNLIITGIPSIQDIELFLREMVIMF